MAHLLLGGVDSGQAPSAFAGLQGWYKADAGVYSDAGVTLAADTNTVQQWNDQSGNARNLSQGTAGARPTYRTGIRNGLPVVRFGGATDDDFMIGVALSNFFTAGAKTAIGVVMQANSALHVIIGDATAAADTRMRLSSGLVEYTNDDGAADTVTLAATAANYHIATWLHSSGSIYVGATDTRTASMSTVASGNTSTLTADLWLGSEAAGANFLDGDIAELAIFNVALSEADRKQIEKYLAYRWGFTLPY